MKDDDTTKKVQEAIENIKDMLTETNDIVPGLGMMVHGLAHCVLDAMAPPESFQKLKDENPDVPMTQEYVEKNHPEVAKDVEAKAEEVSKLVEQCLQVMRTSPPDLCQQAVRLVNRVKVRKEMGGKGNMKEFFQEAMSLTAKGGDDERNDDVTEAPLKGGWAANCKGNA